jgi:hypothetical protein
MQLLLDATAPDFASWKAKFDAQAENIRNAGMSLLQIWRDADQPGEVTLLFEVNDRIRAQAWLDKEQAFGTALRARFVNTA